MGELPNLIVIILDTLRKDYDIPVRNVLEKFGFVSYERAIAPAPWTIPSHASMLTGLYPAFHGAHETKNRKIPSVKLDKKDNLLTFKLKEFGYNTALLTSNFFVHPHFGFVGFDNVYYVPPIPEIKFLSDSDREILRKIVPNQSNFRNIFLELVRKNHYGLLLKGGAQYLMQTFYKHFFALFKHWPTEKGISQIISYLNRYLSKNKSENMFIFINSIEMHEPYLVNDNLKILSDNLKTNSLDMGLVTAWRQRYVTESEYLGKKLFELLSVLKKHNVLDNSLVVVTSDHGQLLGEHGRIGHGNFLYDELLMVPLFIKYPQWMSPNLDKTVVQGSWISLTSLKSLITHVALGKIPSKKVLFSDTVFAESYGIAGRVSINSKREKLFVKKLEKYRIAVYHRAFKAIFNVNDWKFECIKPYDPTTEIDDIILRHMKREITKFLRVVTSTKISSIR